MSMIPVPSTLPPGYIGNPYTPIDIDVFWDLNWPDESGVLSAGGLQGLGDDTVDLSSDFPATGGFAQTNPAGPIWGTGTDSGSGGGTSASDIASLITAAGAATGSALRSTQSPSLIPGTSAIYNPQTGQILSSTGSPSSLTSSSLSSMLPIVGLGIATVVVISMLGKK